MTEFSDERVLAFIDRQNPNDPEMGYALAFASILEDGSLRSASKSEFPNNGDIRIRKGVEALINRGTRLVSARVKYDVGFREDDWRSCKWLCLHEHHLDVIKRWAYCEVLKTDSLSLQSRHIELTRSIELDFRPLGLVFLLVEKSGYLYGPFEVIKIDPGSDNDGWQRGQFICDIAPVSTSALPQPFSGLLAGEQYAALKVPLNADILSSMVGPSSDSGGRQLLRIEQLNFKDAVVVDCATEAELEKWLGKALKQVTSSPGEHIESLRHVQNLLRSKARLSSDLWRSRVERLTELGELSVFDGGISPSIDMKQLWSKDTPERREFIDANFEELIKGTSKVKLYERDLKEKDSDLKDIKKEIRLERTALKEHIKSNINAGEQANLLDQQIREKGDRLKSIDKVTEEEIQRIEKNNRERLGKLTENLSDLKLKVDNAHREVVKAKEERDKLENEKEIFEAQIRLEKGQYTTSLIKHASLSEALAGRKPSRKVKAFQSREFKTFDSLLSVRNEVFNKCREAFEALDRGMTPFDSACLITAVIQNFFCVLYGHPGAGKTSLTRIITKLLVGDIKTSQNFIQVQRGWARGSEILGFQNVLNNTREYDSFGFFKNLEYFNQNRERCFDDEMLMVTLDEANLSALEHYWSDFIGVTDDFVLAPHLLRYETGHEFSELDTESSISVPPGMRFLATINTDNTTEPMSERVLSRATFLHVDVPEEINGEMFNLNSVEPLNIRTEDLHSAFNIGTPLPDLESDTLQKLKSSFNCLKITPRKELAIRRFLSVLENYAVENDIGEGRVLDQALCRFVIPAIKGQQLDFLNELEDLCKELKDREFNQSVKMLEDIIQVGKSNGSYYEGLWAL